MITKTDLIIGYLTTIDVTGKSGKVFLPGETFAVTEIVEVNGMKAYITNKIHKAFKDGTFEPLVIMENMVKEFRPIQP